MLCFRRMGLHVIVAVWLLSAASGCSSTGRNFFGFSGWTNPPGPAPAPGAGPSAGPGQGPATMPGQGPSNSSVRTTPPITGNQLALKPDESATQRALELAQRLTEAQEEKKALAARTRKLEAELADKDQALAASAREVQAATEEVRRTKAELEQWKPQMTALAKRLQSAEKENATTLQSIVSSLEQILEQQKAADEAPEPRQPPPAKATERERK